MEKGQDKTREQVMNELVELRQRIAQLEASEKERVQTEKTPLLLDENHQNLFKLFPIGVTVLDMKGVILYSNPAVYSKGSYTENEFTGKHFSKIAPIRFKDIPTFIRVFNSVVKGKIPKPFEVIYQRKDGTNGWTELSINLVKMGRKRRILVMQHDTTENKRSLETLQENERKFRSLFDNMLNGYAYCKIIVDENNQPIDFVYLEINDAFEQMTGLKREDVIGKKVTQAIPGTREVTPELFDIYGKVALTREPTKFDIYFKPLSIWLTISVYSPQKDYFVAIFENITERKQAEEELQKAEQNFRNSMDDSPLGIRIFTAEGELLYANQAILNIYGYSSFGELRDTPRKQRYTPESYKEHMERVEQRKRGELQRFYEMSIVRKDGEIRHLQAFRKEIHWNGERQFQAMYHDITERKQMEATIGRRVELEKTISSVSSKFIGIYDIDKAINDSLDEMGKLCGGSRAYLFLFRETGTTMDNTHEWCAEGVSPQRDNLTNLPCDMFPWRMIKLHQGETIHITDVSKMPSAANVEKEMLESQNVKSLLVLPVFIDRELNGFIGLDNVVAPGEWGDDDLMVLRVSSEIIGNALQYKRVEEREKGLQQELNLASRLATVGEMAAGIAHEINNPLTGVVGFSGLLLKKDIPEDVRKDVNIINEGAQRISSVTSRMLAFAHQHESKQATAKINDIIETTLTMRSYNMESSNIKVTTELDPELPVTAVDAVQIQQVFLNIILNAEIEMKKAYQGGNLTVKTERIGNTIRISFQDDGPGIPKKNLDKIFDPFFTTREVGEGTGLGLSVSYGIVTQHGGKIYVQSRFGKGATFFVELPIVSKEEQLEITQPATGVSKKLSRARILVVDDKPPVQDFLNEILSEEGHEVEIVDNGDDALDRLGSENYDVILLDVKLSDMSGIEIYKYIQKSVKSLARRVIFVTGDVISKDTIVFIKSAEVPYITKPFDAEQLKKGINHILSQQL